MSRRAILPQHRRHIHVYDDDWDFLETHFANSGVSPGVAVREMIHKWVVDLRRRVNERLDTGTGVGQ